MTRVTGHLLLLALAAAIGTWFGGWWALPVVAGLYGLRGGAPSVAALATGTAWGILLLLLPAAPLGRLLGRLGGLVHLPGGVAVVGTLGYAALLGWSAARVLQPAASRQAA